MAKKTLLSEGQVRHFMKLASITPLAETFLSEMEDPTEEEGEALELDDEAEAEAPESEVPAGEPSPEEYADALGMLGQSLSVLTGEDVVVSGGADEAAEEEVDAIAEDEEDKGPPNPTPPEDDPRQDAPQEFRDDVKRMRTGQDPLMFGQTLRDLRENVQVIDDEKIVQEVAARVAKRLLKESRQDQLAESLAKRIAEKLR